MSSSPKIVTTTSNSAPWSAQQPYLSDIFKRAQALADTPQQFFPGATVVPLSGQTEQALQRQEQRALAGSPLLRQAQANVLASLGGQGSPALGSMMELVGRQLRPGLDAQFAGAGRYGSGAHANALASALTDAGTRLAYQDYRNALGMAPSLAMQDYADIGQLAAVGQAREQQVGAQLQDQMSRFNFAQQEPIDRLQRYAALVGGGSFGSSQTTQAPHFSNPWMDGLGLGLDALRAYGDVFGKNGAFPGGTGFWDIFD